MRSWSRRFVRPDGAHLHVHPIAAWRRLAIGALTVPLCALLFHGYVSAGLVNRGDDLLRAGQPERSLAFYQRAMFFDPAWDTPVDRLGFAASMSGQRGFLRFGVAIATRYLDRYPTNEKIRWDRAMCYLHLGQQRAGYADMKVLARESFVRHDDDARRYADISYNLARRLGALAEAREFGAMRVVQ